MGEKMDGRGPLILLSGMGADRSVVSRTARALSRPDYARLDPPPAKGHSGDLRRADGPGISPRVVLAMWAEPRLGGHGGVGNGPGTWMPRRLLSDRQHPLVEPVCRGGFACYGRWRALVPEACGGVPILLAKALKPLAKRLLSPAANSMFDQLADTDGRFLRWAEPGGSCDGNRNPDAWSVPDPSDPRAIGTGCFRTGSRSPTCWFGGRGAFGVADASGGRVNEFLERSMRRD